MHASVRDPWCTAWQNQLAAHIAVHESVYCPSVHAFNECAVLESFSLFILFSIFMKTRYLYLIALTHSSTRLPFFTHTPHHGMPTLVMDANVMAACSDVIRDYTYSIFSIFPFLFYLGGCGCTEWAIRCINRKHSASQEESEERP